jgi:hypothetical protein
MLHKQAYVYVLYSFSVGLSGSFNCEKICKKSKKERIPRKQKNITFRIKK